MIDFTKIPSPDYQDTIVWRIQNNEGQGPFTGGGVRYIPESYFESTVPAERAGFHPLVYNLLVQGKGKCGCLNKEELVRLITPAAMSILEKNGFSLVAVRASMVWEASNQVIYVI